MADDDSDDLFGSVEKSPSYWMQVALLEFLQSLQAVRSAKGAISNRELAERVGVSPPTLSRWLNGNENLTVSTMCRLAVELGAAVHIHVADNSEWGCWRADKPAESSAAGEHTQNSGAAPFTASSENVVNFHEWLRAAPGKRATLSPNTSGFAPPELAEHHG